MIEHMTNEPTVPVPTNGPLAPPSASDSFFNSVRRLNLVRTDDRWVGGVAAGLAHRLGWDPLIVRGLFFISFFFGGLGLIAYGVAWALLPEDSDGRIHLQEALRGRFDPALIGAGLITLAGMVSNGPLSWMTHRFFSWNSGLFSLVTGLFWALFWTVAIVLFVRWAVDRKRMRKHLKTLPDYAGSSSFSEADSSLVSNPVNDDEPFLYEDEADGGLVASAVIADSPSAITDANVVPATEVIETIVETVPESEFEAKAAQKAAAKAAAEERAQERAIAAKAAAAARAEARVKANEERAYYRQQRDVEKYQRALERSRLPITKGPGIVTLLLTLGALFLVWTAFQAAMRGYLPGMLHSTFANPLMWAGIALLIVGLGIFISGIRGRKSGALSGLAWLGLAGLIPVSFLAAAAFGGQVAWSNGVTDWMRPAATAQAIGTAAVTPATTAQAELGFRGSFGSPTIDLSQLDLSHATAANPVTIPIEWAVGDVLVILPPEARVEANIRLTAGSIYWQVTEPENYAVDNLQYGEVVFGTGDGYMIRTTQTFDQAYVMRAPVFITSDAARLHGANLRLMISSGAGNVTLRETAPTSSLVNH